MSDGSTTRAARDNARPSGPARTPQAGHCPVDGAAAAAAVLHLPITLAHAKGAYTVSVGFGSRRRPANLVLDTGSSTLVVLPHAYDAVDDDSLVATSWAQEVRYGQGVWAGPVLRAMLHVGEGDNAQRVEAAPFALVEAAVQDMRGADGIFGLAYDGLDTAHDVAGYLSERGTAPSLTWPWPFSTEDLADLDSFGTLLRQQPPVPLTPLFSAMAKAGLVQDRFALLMRRALVHVTDDAADAIALQADPLNQGMLILGGGEDCTGLYSGPMQDVAIVHDLYYNAHLVALRIGDRPRIAAPPLAGQDVRRAASNAIVDTGSSFLVMEASLYDAVIAGLAAHDPRLGALVEKFQQAFQHDQRGVSNAEVDALDWPDLQFVLQAPDGGETVLTCTPEQYWPRNALRAGESLFLLMRQLPHWPAQSILGLPLLAGHYVVFDRGGPGCGRLRIARAAAPA